MPNRMLVEAIVIRILFSLDSSIKNEGSQFDMTYSVAICLFQRPR